MESVSLIDNVLFSMDTFLDHFSDTRRRESRIAFPPSVDWTRCNDELRNRVVGAIVHQLTKNLSIEEIKNSGFAPYFVDHTTGIWPQAASGMPFSAATFQSTGDPITDLTEDMAAEQKARTTYDNILRLVDDPDVITPIRFLREREIVHYQRFGEALRMVQEDLDSRNFYAFNPAYRG